MSSAAPHRSPPAFSCSADPRPQPHASRLALFTCKRKLTLQTKLGWCRTASLTCVLRQNCKVYLLSQPKCPAGGDSARQRQLPPNWDLIRCFRSNWWYEKLRLGVQRRTSNGSSFGVYDSCDPKQPEAPRHDKRTASATV